MLTVIQLSPETVPPDIVPFRTPGPITTSFPLKPGLAPEQLEISELDTEAEEKSYSIGLWANDKNENSENSDSKKYFIILGL